jgi:hypothetical protein
MQNRGLSESNKLINNKTRSLSASHTYNLKTYSLIEDSILSRAEVTTSSIKDTTPPLIEIISSGIIFPIFTGIFHFKFL